MMKQKTLHFLLLAGIFFGSFLCVRTTADVVYSDGMETTTNGWNEGSNATNEPGDSSGGIRVVSGDKFQMNSWWDGAGWTSIWKDTGHIIEDGTVYKFTASMTSYANGKEVTLKFQDANDSWSVIKEGVVNPVTGSYTDCSISFDSSNYSDSVGHSLGIVVNAGWWNNLALTEITVETNPSNGNLIYFDTTEAGVSKPLDFWGVDQTWVSSKNMTSTIENLRLEETDAVRIKFPASEPLEYDSNGDPSIPESSYSVIDKAMQQVLRAPDAKLTLSLGSKRNLSHWYVDKDGYINPVRWVDAVVATINYVNGTHGYTIDDWAFVEVYNEPDWRWPVGSKSNMAEVMAEFRTRSELDSIPLLGPSTLSASNAQSWYNVIKPYTDIAGTHVINGSMSQFINFVNSVHADDRPFINPEIHNLVESIIHAEYSDRVGEGGLFWGGVNPAEGRFAKACKGDRIAYKTDEATWTASCAYRDLQGRIWLFAASNERHAYPSRWEFRCTNRDVFFDDVGPARSTTVTMGGHASNYIEVTWGDRNPLYFYQYVDNVGDNTRMAVSGGALYTTSTSDTSDYARWEFRPTVAFFFIDNVGAENAAQNCRLSATTEGNSIELASNSTTDDFAKWQLTKTGSDFYLENIGMQRAGVVVRLKAGSRSSIILTESSDTSSQATWSFSDTGVIDTTPPSAPENLTTITGDSRIKLDWADSGAWDFNYYSVYRSLISGGSYYEIASGLIGSNYEDDTAENHTSYYYVITAVDAFSNESAFSNEVKMTAQVPAAYDDFETRDFAGGSGWDGNWTPSGSATPSIETLNDIDTVKITYNSAVTRTISVPIYEGILYFKYDVDALESDDYVAAEIYDWISEKWVSVWTGYYYDNGLDSVGGGNDIPDNLQEMIIDLSAYGVYINQIRFKASANSINDVLFIDDIAVFHKTYKGPSPEIVYYDDMVTTTNGWNEGSNAGNEPGDTTGGIRVADYGGGPFIQMNSWWNGAGWTSIWKDTGHTIKAKTKYKFIATMNSFSGGDDDVALVFKDVDDNWSNISLGVVYPAANYYNDYSATFNTVDYPDSVGHSLGIRINAGWWNNLGLNKILVEAHLFCCLGDFDQSGFVDFYDLAVLGQGWQTTYDMNDLQTLADDWLKSSD